MSLIRALSWRNGSPRGVVSVSEYQAQKSEQVNPQTQDAESPESALADLTDRTLFDLQWVYFSWDVLQSGDCFCRHTELRLYSDGLADFSAYTSTTDSGDVWLFKGIALLNSNGEELFRIGQFDGPRMELTSYDYFVIRTRSKNPLIFPPQLYPIISGARIYYHC